MQPRRIETRPAHAPDQKNLFTMTKSSPFSRRAPFDLSRRQGIFPSEQVRSCKSAAAPAGGASRDRTGDLKLAKLALSQLSYGPCRFHRRPRRRLRSRPVPPATTTSPAKQAGSTGDHDVAREAYRLQMVGPEGFEPSTPRLSSVCSNQLSYRPYRVAEPCSGKGCGDGARP